MLHSVMSLQRFVVLEHLTAYLAGNLRAGCMNTFNMSFDMSSYFETFPTQQATKHLDPSLIISSTHIGVIIELA